MSANSTSVHERVPGERTLLVDALVGAVATVVLSFVPFSPVLGGIVAGYLHRDRGPRVGGLSGLFASVPLVVLIVLALVVMGFGIVVPPGTDGTVVLVGFLLFVVLVALLVAAFNVVLGAVGGVLGVALVERAERKRRVRPVGASTPTGEPLSDDDA